MAYERYLSTVTELTDRIRDSIRPTIAKAAVSMADSIKKGRAVYLFGSGHSVMPCLDVFPRYGGYAGFVPMTDPRLMWFTVSGQGGAEELIWLERQEGYIGNFLRHYNITPSDTVVVFSHGGLNAAPVEVALHGKEKGATVIAVTCKDNLRVNKPVHSSGKRLADIADIVIDNCVSYEDAQVSIEGVTHKVGAVSTVAFIVIAQCLVVETAALLAESGIPVSPFVSPNVPGVSKDHNPNVFEQYNRLVRGL